MRQDPAYGVFKNLLFDSLMEAAGNGKGPDAERWARGRAEAIVARWGDGLQAASSCFTLSVLKAFNFARDAIGIADAGGRHYFQNNAFTELFGYSAEELASAGGPKALYPDHSTFKQVFDCLMSGCPFDGEVEMRARCGRILPVSLRADAILDGGGKIEGLIGIHTDLTKQRGIDEMLRQKEAELSQKTRELFEMNEAHKKLTAQMEEDREITENRMVSNINDFVMPYVRRMKEMKAGSDPMVFVNVIEKNLNGILAPMMERLDTGKAALTPREIEVANLVMTGATSKEIAGLLNISKRAVEFHRDSLRTKLGLKKSKKNLKAYLDSISNTGSR